MSDFKKPDHKPDLEVELNLLPTDQGGRKDPLWQGCRAPHDFGLPDEMNDGLYWFPEGPPAPGESKRAFVWLLSPERNKARLSRGFEFKFMDGGFVAKGKIINVINPILMREAEQRSSVDSQGRAT